MADFTLNSNRGIALGTSHGRINTNPSTTLTYCGIIAGSNNLTKSELEEKFNQDIDELNQETEELVEEIEKWQT